MHIKIIKPAQDGRKVYDNTGSVDRLIEYLQHEAKDAGRDEKDIFFSETDDNVSAAEVRDQINSNVKGVRADQEKFFSIVVSPSEDELLHIRNSDEALKSYVRQVMENYAQTYKLKNHQELHSEDLVWYATIHQDREVKNLDLNNLSFLSKAEQARIGQLHDSEEEKDTKEIERIFQRAVKREQGKLDQAVFTVGDRKPGLNKHVHIVVSRRDRTQRIMLNPRTIKERFHIRGFQEKSARDFQRMFGYEKETIREGFYRGYEEKDRVYFEKKISVAADHINQHLNDEKIDAQRLQDIGERCHYSRAFFVNLNKLKYRFVQGDPTHDPYFFAERGRDQKPSEYFRTLDRGYFSQGRQGDESSVPYAGREVTTGTSYAKRLLQQLGGINSGPGMIKETLLFDEERKRLRKYKERGQDGDNVEMS